MLALVLRRQGYQVVIATSKATALAARDHEHFDLLIGDLQLADGSDCDLMQSATSNRSLIPDTERNPKSLKLEMGFSAQLLKPVDNVLLLRAVAQFVAGGSDGISN